MVVGHGRLLGLQNRNNCTQCKIARRDAKELRKRQLRKERQAVRELGRRGVMQD
ncbi:hypothetical protein [Pseudoflavonifractor phocaeensis]|uniref:hypothetical protein n=1 Tax=Pseudoflavonifractor phocaeensis TaxID=1870988 RepID=UPI00195E532B|nr:hypothetical protein [Pseudoflavonifractor phocaeensis]MBM6722543.1 hypothetical protein [Pseudoflavonifractor phocaeensis]